MRGIRRLSQRLVRRTSLLVCLALITSILSNNSVVSSSGSRVVSVGRDQAQSRNGKAKKVPSSPPQPGAPAINLPNLDEARRRRPGEVRAAEPIPSTMRSRRKRGPRRGDRPPPLRSASIKGRSDGSDRQATMGGGERTMRRDSRRLSDGEAMRTHHARVNRMSSANAAPLPGPEPQAGSQNVVWTNIVGVTATGNSLSKTAGNGWGNAGASSQQMIVSGDGYVEFTVSSNTMAVMAGLSHDDIDQSWQDLDFGICPSNDGVVYIFEAGSYRGSFGGYAPGDRFRVAIEGGVVKYYRNNLLLYSSSVPPAYPLVVDSSLYSNGGTISSAVMSGNLSTAGELALARLDPFNQTGNQLEARDCEWSLPLLSLPGRAGLDLGLTLSYSSLVWTRAGNYIYFDEDEGTPSPGFRLGFPTIGNVFFDPQAAVNARLMVTSAGRRVELRQVNGSNVYAAADSSYLELIDYGSSLLLRAPDGTLMAFAKSAAEWHCVAVEDRNGNLITVNYNDGDISNITDTLGRVINFEYDTNDCLNRITQTWSGQTDPHVWATFGWSTKAMQANFSGVTPVGLTNGDVIPVLSQVGLADGSRYTFAYAGTMQVYLIQHYTSDHLRSQTAYDYEGNADCPRIWRSRTWAEYWNGDTNGVPAANEEVSTGFHDNGDGSRQVTMPDGTVYKEMYGGTGDSPLWQHGLVTGTEIWGKNDPSDLAAPSIKQKWTIISYTQDNENVSYPTNPRVIETNIYDNSGNRRRTTISYDHVNQGQSVNYAQYGLPYLVTEYGSDATTERRRTYTEYNLDQAYLDYHLIGLVSAVYVYDPVLPQFESKTTYSYDEADKITSQASTAMQHNPADDALFLVRGNVTSVWRWDVNHLNEQNYALHTQVGYNAAGSVLSTIDPAGHQSFIYYADSFSANGTDLDAPRDFSTFAYPTTVTDADGYQSSVRYNYEFGAPTWKQTPQPNTTDNLPGPAQKFEYDAATRPMRVTNLSNNAYTRYEYGPNDLVSYSSINYVGDEAMTDTTFDGLGLVFVKASPNPGSTGGWKAQWTQYDVMGRVMGQSNPTETTSGWIPAGDDAAGWHYIQQTYDWKGRPLLTVNPGTTSNPNDVTYKEASYSGCGCAGGEVVTLTDEVGRQQKVYSDVLGRQWKTEVLNWDSSVYSTTESTLNARDQATFVRQFQGSDQSGVYQDTTMSYDGYGRLQTKHVPEQNAGTATVYAYNSDDTIQSVTDARGAVANYIYNNSRHLVNEIHYSAPSGVTPTSNVTFGYDAAGNRTSMMDGLGTKSYSYNQLSQLMSETRDFNGVGTFALSYDYNLAGEVKTVTDQHASVTFNTSYDDTGRVAGLSSSSPGLPNTTFVSALQYRAWGATKSVAYGNNSSVSFGYDNRGRVSGYSYTWGNMAPLGSTYQYYDNGQVKFAHDQSTANSIRDRAYQYDHAARLTEAYSGTEARNFVNNISGGTADGPYRQSYAFDGWSNMLSGGGRYWSRTDVATNSYTEQTNRNPSWSYDADGNLITRNEPPINALPFHPGTYSYDAAGRQTSVTETSSFNGFNGTYYQQVVNVFTDTQTYDGDGHVARYVKEWTENGSNHCCDYPLTTYYLRSTVLGGRVISEYSGQGAWETSYAYAGAERGGRLRPYWSGQPTLAEWRFADPVTGDEVLSGSGDFSGWHTLLDPNAVDVGTTDPFAPDGSGDPITEEAFTGANGKLLGIANNGGYCVVDGGIAIDCSMLTQDSVVRCWDNDCGPRRVDLVDANGNPAGSALTLPFQAFADGTEGFFLPGEGPASGSYHGQKPSKEAGKECDERLKQIFGDKDAVFATDRDPDTLRSAPGRIRDVVGESPATGDAHLYARGTGEGSTTSYAYTPTGFNRELPYSYPRPLPGGGSEKQNNHYFNYAAGALQRFGYSGGLQINFVHTGPTDANMKPMAANPAITNDRGSIAVGVIGGFGNIVNGELLDPGGAGENGGNVHTHLIFYKLNQRGQRAGPIDPRKVFCGDLGF